MKVDLSRARGLRCLVVGGGGFIGSHLCCALVAAGARVRTFGRRGPQITPPAVEWIYGSLDDVDTLSSALQGVDVVYHLLGGVSPASVAGDLEIELQRSVAASIRLFELCRVSAIRRIVMISSGGTVYGIPRVSPISEAEPTDPISPYGINKLTIEKYLQYYAHAYGIEHVVMRLANPFGPLQMPGRGQGLIAALLMSAIHGEPFEVWGDGKTVRDYLFVREVAQALVLAACYSGSHRTFNVGSGQGRSILEIVRDVALLTGAEGLPVVHKDARPTDVPINVLDCALIQHEFGWRPTMPWMTSLAETANWIRELKR